ncbi:hypothetical protein ABZP36_025806 [Zizania latifolia]
MQGLDQPTMASELRALAWTALLVPACAWYARSACCRLRPGLPRFAALLPTFPVFACLPWLYNSLHLRLFSTFFHTWLAVNKLVLLALGLGPLRPSLPLVPFVLCACLPIKLRLLSQQPSKQSSSQPPLVADFFVPCLRSFLFLSCLAVAYPHMGWLPIYGVHFFYCIHVFLTLDLVLSSIALASAAVLGTELERQFSTPLAVASLNDFWGRQWNLMAVDLLRTSAYEPVRARWGRQAGVLAAFLMSGLLHELLYWYLTQQRPKGEMVLFFMLHGVSQIAERWARAAGLWRPPKVAAYLLVSAFMVITISELFFGPFMRAGADVRLMEESAAMLELIRGVSKHLLRPFGIVGSSK